MRSAERTAPDGARLRGALRPGARAALAAIETFPSIDSTNSYLTARAARGAAHGSVAVAAQQTAGRGRRGRRWSSPPGASLALSLLWRFALPPARLGGVSLTTGVAVADALGALGVDGVGVKWPNDVLWRHRKLCGILVECDRDGAAVIGVGVNLRLSDQDVRAVGQPACSLADALTPTPDLETVAAALLNRLVPALQRYAETGFAAAAWSRYDLSYDRAVVVRAGADEIRGVGRGVDDDGALLLQTAAGLRRCVAGDVSLRLRA